MRAGGPRDCAVDTASASFGAQTFWGRQGPVFLALHFPHGPGVYISLSKLPNVDINTAVGEYSTYVLDLIFQIYGLKLNQNKDTINKEK